MRVGVIALMLVSTLAHADYEGVVPGRSAPKKNEGPPNTLTWVGFQVEGSAPRVFLQLTSPPKFQQKIVGRELMVTLPGFRASTKNNTRPLKTEAFGTDIDRVVAKPIKGGLELHVRFRGSPRMAKTRAADEADGWSYLYLDF